LYLFKKAKELRAFLDKQNRPVAFVPTMGALHEGHLSLVEEAAAMGGLVVVSIFVNPTQFDNKEDLVKYPRTVVEDVQLLIQANTDVLYLPTVDDVYPNGTEPQKHFDFGQLDKTMEGAFRDGHFEGVAQVVARLLTIVDPDHLVMGQKDIQQTAIVRSMLKQSDFKAELFLKKTVRDPDGLAMSSRNRRLTPAERLEAPILYATIQATKDMHGKMSIAELKAASIESIERSGYFKVDYFEVVNLDTMQLVDDWSESDELAICVAAFIGKIRLIDNVLITKMKLL